MLVIHKEEMCIKKMTMQEHPTLTWSFFVCTGRQAEDVEPIIHKVRDALVAAGSSFRLEKIEAYKRAIDVEANDKARWVLETILENACVAKDNRSPLCDDTGIPHLVVDIGKNKSVSGEIMDAIYEGISEGLEALPGRPIAIKGNDVERIEQSGDLDGRSSSVEPAPFLVRRIDEDVLRLHILMFGGGPAIWAKTYRVFHKHSLDVVIDEIVEWSIEGVSELGCSPCTLGVGIGRSHYEATSMMLQALVDGKYSVQNKMEQEITRRVNEADIGALGLHGNTSVLGTFMKVGPQRASGVRIVCVKPCCCFEPRIASVEL